MLALLPKQNLTLLLWLVLARGLAGNFITSDKTQLDSIRQERGRVESQEPREGTKNGVGRGMGSFPYFQLLCDS